MKQLPQIYCKEISLEMAPKSKLCTNASKDTAYSTLSLKNKCLNNRPFFHFIRGKIMSKILLNILIFDQRGTFTIYQNELISNFTGTVFKTTCKLKLFS